MVGRKLAVMMLVLVASYAGLAPAAAVTPGWHLVFSDRFRTVRSADWTANWLGSPAQVTKPPNSYEFAAMDPGQASFRKSGLVLSTRAAPWTAPDGTRFPYRSGAITGYQKQGYLPPLMAVVRLWLRCSPQGQIANWPSFWLVGDPYNWPQDGEIDVVEGLGGVAAWHAHFVDARGVEGPGAVAPGNWCGWHTFRVVWNSDGRLGWQYDKTWVGHVTGYTATAPEFPVIMYSMAPRGTGLSDCPPACSGPVAADARIRVAWVRIYRR
jgi:hypothetical protein